MSVGISEIILARRCAAEADAIAAKKNAVLSRRNAETPIRNALHQLIHAAPGDEDWMGALEALTAWDNRNAK